MSSLPLPQPAPSAPEEPLVLAGFFGFRFLVWMLSFFMASGRGTCRDSKGRWLLPVPAHPWVLAQALSVTFLSHPGDVHPICLTPKGTTGCIEGETWVSSIHPRLKSPGELHDPQWAGLHGGDRLDF